MKIETTLQSEFPTDVIDLVNRYLSERPKTFSERASLLGLDPASDFRYADLALEDFSSSDIRGYDFSGADLRGAIGSNVVWDQSTRLDGADLSASLFAYAIEKKKFFQAHPELEDRANRYKDEYWANTIIAVHSALHDQRMTLNARRRFAEAVFDESSDRTVRSDILIYLRAAYEDPREHLEFLYNVLARQSIDHGTIVAVLRSLSTFYSRDIVTFNTLKSFLRHADPMIVQTAIEGVFASVHFFAAYADIWAITKSSRNSSMRRSLVQKIAQKEFGEGALLLADDLINNFLDYEEAISKKRLERIARRSLSAVRYEVARKLEQHFDISSRGSANQQQADTRSALIVRCTQHLEAKYGVPFCFTD